VPDDAPELVRLREVMLADVDGREPEPGEWRAIAEETLRKGLADPDGPMAAFVVEQPERRGGLAACVIGVIERRLGSPQNPTGESGYVYNVATDRDHRRRGYSRACMEALLGWYRQRGVRTIDLHASAAGEPLYRSLGFARKRDAAMRLTDPY
jgi:GNAT superfamily N-acetyltransferase